MGSPESTPDEENTPAGEPQRFIQTAEGGHDASEAVLLYYKYVHLGEERRAAVSEWYLQTCGAEGLRGRVRVALDGVNCTLGGAHAALRRHIGSIMAHSDIEGKDIDFKLSVSQGPRNVQAAEESGFTTLSVKAVKEVVSMGPRGAGLSHRQGGRHISPQEFHGFLRQEMARKQKEMARAEQAIARKPQELARTEQDNARAKRFQGERETTGGAENVRAGARVSSPGVRGQGGAEEVSMEEAVDGGEEGGRTREPVVPGAFEDKEAVLLDVRNVYETSIGHFRAEGVERLDPETRQFSQLPKWVDENVDRLRGKRVLMYCTGGVRCEMASAFLRQHCDADATGTEILQLSGGIERYLEAYPSKEKHAYANIEEGGRSGGGVSEGVGEGGWGGGGVSEGSEEMRVASDGGGRGTGTAEGREEEDGLFRGKNFVFDERVSVPEVPAGGAAVGCCILCERPWDDYGSRSRCSRCRMLVLVCDACVEIRKPEKASPAPGQLPELCTESANRFDAAALGTPTSLEDAADIGETAQAGRRTDTAGYASRSDTARRPSARLREATDVGETAAVVTAACPNATLRALPPPRETTDDGETAAVGATTATARQGRGAEAAEEGRGRETLCGIPSEPREVLRRLVCSSCSRRG